MSHADYMTRLLVFTNRPIILACFSQLERFDRYRLQVSGLLLTKDLSGEPARYLAGASLAAIDVAPDPAAAIDVCRDLHHRAPNLPLLGIVCCKRQVPLSSLQALVAAGVNSLIDLSVTSEALVHTLQCIASGHTVVHMDLPSRDASNMMLTDLIGKGRNPTSASLTEAETRDLLACITRGFSDQEIGKRFSLSPSTVHHRIERLCKVTGTRNRTELAAWAGMWGYYESAQLALAGKNGH